MGSEESAPDRANVEFAWKAHAAIQGWTAGVDTKASIVLVIETAIAAAGATALITSGGELSETAGLQLGLSIAAVTSLVLSVACALWVVFPRLNYRSLNKPGFIYFGQLAQRTPGEIVTALSAFSDTDELSQLADQLAVTSRIAWRKHVWLQRSIALLALGAILLLCSFVAF
jgi:Family of unknown function (DUF5706)